MLCGRNHWRNQTEPAVGTAQNFPAFGTYHVKKSLAAKQTIEIIEISCVKIFPMLEIIGFFEVRSFPKLPAELLRAYG